MKDGEWHCLEYAEPRDHWRKGSLGEEIDVPTKVISIFHRRAVQPQGSGGDEDLPLLEDVDQRAGMLEDASMSAEDGREQRGGEVPEPEGGIQAEEIGPKGVEGALADELGEDYGVINGKRIEETTGLREMRNACQFLGIGKSGGKQKIFNRLMAHCKKGHSRMALEIGQGEKEKDKRDPEFGPDEATQARHRLTHLPFESWCEWQGGAETVRGTRGEKLRALRCLSIMFTSTTVGHQPESDMLKHLGGIDSWTKAILRLPIPGKGGVSLKRCVAGVTAFTTDHVEVILKGDGEPAMRQLLEAVQTTRAGLKLQTKLEYAPAGHHQSNPAERTIQTVLGNTLLEGVRRGLGSQLNSVAWLPCSEKLGLCPCCLAVHPRRCPPRKPPDSFRDCHGQTIPRKIDRVRYCSLWPTSSTQAAAKERQDGSKESSLESLQTATILSGPKVLFLSRGVRRCAQ